MPEEITNQWEKWIKDVEEVSRFELPRYIFKSLTKPPKTHNLYLHTFCDGGKDAWGICIYVRFQVAKDKFESQLIYSSSRVAPTKNLLSTPKKELNAIVLGCKKAISIAKAIEIPTKNLYIHTDSLVCMHWICKEKDQLKTYVRNRIQKIQEAELKILYTPGKENPADLTTKPKPTHTYINNKFWINGPEYL